MYRNDPQPPRELVEVIRQVHAGKKKIPSEIAAHLAEHYSDEQAYSGETGGERSDPGGRHRSATRHYSALRVALVPCANTGPFSRLRLSARSRL
jgi:DNA-binding NarL/FixJ family response regulator